MEKVKKILSTIKQTIFQNKFGVLTFCLCVFLIWNTKESLEKIFKPKDSYAKIKPVDRSIERDRLTCYQNRIPKEIIDFCDSEIEENK